MLRPTFKRGSHAFVFPVVLAPYRDASWRVMLGAGVLPPLAGLLLKYYVVRPLRRRYKLRKVRSNRVMIGTCCWSITMVTVQLCGGAAQASDVQVQEMGHVSTQGSGSRGNRTIVCMCS